MASGQYRIEFTPSAARSFRALPRDIQRRLQPKINALANDPRPPGATALQGGGGLLRIRVGTYRVIYLIEEKRVVVLIVRIGHRRDVYRNL